MSTSFEPNRKFSTAQIRTRLVLIRFFLVLRCQETPLVNHSGRKGLFSACYATTSTTQYLRDVEIGIQTFLNFITQSQKVNKRNGQPE